MSEHPKLPDIVERIDSALGLLHPSIKFGGTMTDLNLLRACKAEIERLRSFEEAGKEGGEIIIELRHAAMHSPAPEEHPKLPDIVERLRTLLAKSGDERWAVEYDDRPNMESNNHIVLAEDTPKHPHKWPGCRIAFMAHDGPKKQDEFNAKAELIAAARNALPALLDELTRLRSPAPAEDGTLPCDVMIAPATILRKGCALSTLMLAISRREGQPTELTTWTKHPGRPFVAEDGEGLREALEEVKTFLTPALPYPERDRLYALVCAALSSGREGGLREALVRIEIITASGRTDELLAKMKTINSLAHAALAQPQEKT